ncbi:MAG TPA: AAA family ATPase, partial [Hymenobacter sp.]
MENALKFLRIQNFKSIKDVTLHPRRVNLIIGEPNVGKSNLLEAMSMLGAGLYERRAQFLDLVLRYETISNLFYDNDPVTPIIVESSHAIAILQSQKMSSGDYHFVCIAKSVLTLYKQFLQEDQVDYRPTYNVEDEHEWELLNMVGGDAMGIADAIHSIRKSSPQQAFFSSYRIQDDGTASALGTESIPPQALPRRYTYLPKQAHNFVYRHSFLESPLGHNLLSV